MSVAVRPEEMTSTRDLLLRMKLEAVEKYLQTQEAAIHELAASVDLANLRRDPSHQVAHIAYCKLETIAKCTPGASLLLEDLEKVSKTLAREVSEKMKTAEQNFVAAFDKAAEAMRDGQQDEELAREYLVKAIEARVKQFSMNLIAVRTLRDQYVSGTERDNRLVVNLDDNTVIFDGKTHVVAEEIACLFDGLKKAYDGHRSTSMRDLREEYPILEGRRLDRLRPGMPAQLTKLIEADSGGVRLVLPEPESTGP